MPNPSAVLYGPGDVRIEDRPVPEPGPGEVQVEVTAIGVCGSDVHYYDHGRIGTRVVEDPMVLGHESAGRISAVGAGVDPGRVGQRVAMEPGVPCGHCRQCRAGRYNLCEGMAFFATPPINGSIARYVTIAADFAHPVPDELDDVQAAMAEPVSVGIWACRRAGVTAGDRVLVIGAGPVGLFTAQVARRIRRDERHRHRPQRSPARRRSPARLDRCPGRRTTRRTLRRVDRMLGVVASLAVSAPTCRPGRPGRSRRDGRGFGRLRRPADSDPRAVDYRHLPVRQHLSHRAGPPRLRLGASCPGGDARIPTAPHAKRRCWSGARTPLRSKPSSDRKNVLFGIMSKIDRGGATIAINRR